MRALAILAALLAVALVAPASSAAGDVVDRPAWTAGDSWTYRTNTTLTPGLNLTGTAVSTVLGTVRAGTGGSTVDAIRVILTGSGTAGGTVETTTGNATVHGDWTATGEERFESTNLHPVYSLLDLRVNGTYQNLVPFSIRVQNTTTFDIITDAWKYPLPVGGSGSLETAYAFTQDFYGPGGTTLHANGTGLWTLAFSMGAGESVATPAATFLAYPTVKTWPDGSAERSWYAPLAGNDVLTETFDAGGNLTSETVLVAYRYQALEPATFLGLTLIQWGLILPVVLAAGVAAVLLVRRGRGKKSPQPPEGEETSEVTSGPRGP